MVARALPWVPALAVGDVPTARAGTNGRTGLWAVNLTTHWPQRRLWEALGALRHTRALPAGRKVDNSEACTAVGADPTKMTSRARKMLAVPPKTS